MKPCYEHLGCQGCYIDDTYLQQQLLNDALNSLNACKSLLTSLGLLIHPEKSFDIPSQIATVLGFTIYSLDMTMVVFSRRRLSRLTLLRVLCLQTKLSDLKMIGVFTRKIIFHVGNLRSATARIKQFE